MKSLLGILIFVLVASSANADMAVVVSKRSQVDTLDKREVANIFLSKTNRFPNGVRFKTFELRDDNFKKIFYRGISGKTLAQINSYWTTLIFTGKGKPPRNIEQMSRLKEALDNNDNAITYIPINQVTDGMHVVYIVPVAQ